MEVSKQILLTICEICTKRFHSPIREHLVCHRLKLRHIFICDLTAFINKTSKISKQI